MIKPILFQGLIHQKCRLRILPLCNMYSTNMSSVIANLQSTTNFRYILPTFFIIFIIKTVIISCNNICKCKSFNRSSNIQQHISDAGKQGGMIFEIVEIVVGPQFQNVTFQSCLLLQRKASENFACTPKMSQFFKYTFLKIAPEQNLFFSLFKSKT